MSATNLTWTYAFDDASHLPPTELRDRLGGKGAGLVIMATELGLPVPPGFVIGTEACRTYTRTGWPEGLDEELRQRLAQVEAATGRHFGDAADPLLVSVRSGAPVSMPGMLDTVLNLGLNDDTTAGLARVSGDPAFARACHERLAAMMRQTVGVDVLPDDPWAQLRLAIEAVFRSWDSPRARTYREREGIPADLGTAVVVQAMVFGNRGPDSATGVLFTRDPSTGRNVLYGDVLFGAQGEDVVAGTHATQPIAVLEERLPAVAAELREHARQLERHFGDVCDIEFTIEAGRLWLLQTRIGKRTTLAACRTAIEMAEDDAFPLTRRQAVERVAGILAAPPTVTVERSGNAQVVARGLGASPGVATGAIATTPEAAVEMATAGAAVLLVRSETSPDDVHGMARSAGILTSTGGLASHAAVVARGWDIPAVVGAREVHVRDGSVTIGERTFPQGTVISIDGGSGEIFDGPVEASFELAPEAARLLDWARELGVALDEEASARGGWTTNGPGGGQDMDEGHDALVRALAIRGHVMPEQLASALGLNVEAAAESLERAAAGGLVRTSAGTSSLTDAGKALAAQLLAADREAWGPEAAQAALDRFLDLDGRMKTIVTAWQMKEVDGQPVLNDHADTAYDAAVLADFAGLHTDASAWLAPLPDGLPRLGVYGQRLGAAAAAVAQGDHRYIASPRLDSYHGVWFELHEDLIRLAGTTREEEVAAGRA
jgi:pyruvate, orthophosphate dikinase